MEDLGLMRFSWKGRRVLVTGHTGFKGSWLSALLLSRGAEVFGLSLPPNTSPALFDQLGLASRMDHEIGDIRDRQLLASRIAEVQPEIIIHMAAQPLVRYSYREPIETWSTNVMGTAHLLDALRDRQKPCAVIVVTTDKVYENQEWDHPYAEDDRLGGSDPYSASKAGTELVVQSYQRSFFKNSPIRVVSARAGNVIGGGDWAEDRILPDLARARAKGETLQVRNAVAIRPWQHVLDPLAGYLLLAEKLILDGPLPETAYNFGPELVDQRNVADLVSAAHQHWEGAWENLTDSNAPHEAGKLMLNIERAERVLGWKPRWNFDRAVKETILWYRNIANGGDARVLTQAQIRAFEREEN